MEDRRAHTRRLMHEIAFIENSSGNGWVPIVLLDITVNGATFACSEILLSGHAHTLRFTLPGTPKLHFVSATLLPRTTDDVPSGYRYGARFSRIDPSTINHIVQFLSEPV